MSAPHLLERDLPRFPANLTRKLKCELMTGITVVMVPGCWGHQREELACAIPLLQIGIIQDRVEFKRETQVKWNGFLVPEFLFARGYRLWVKGEGPVVCVLFFSK